MAACAAPPPPPPPGGDSWGQADRWEPPYPDPDDEDEDDDLDNLCSQNVLLISLACSPADSSCL